MFVCVVFVCLFSFVKRLIGCDHSNMFWTACVGLFCVFLLSCCVVIVCVFCVVLFV